MCPLAYALDQPPPFPLALVFLVLRFNVCYKVADSTYGCFCCAGRIYQATSHCSQKDTHLAEPRTHCHVVVLLGISHAGFVRVLLGFCLMSLSFTWPREDSDAPIKSFLRCTLVQIRPFLWSGTGAWAKKSRAGRQTHPPNFETKT